MIFLRRVEKLWSALPIVSMALAVLSRCWTNRGNPPPRAVLPGSLGLGARLLRLPPPPPPSLQGLFVTSPLSPHDAEMRHREEVPWALYFGSSLVTSYSSFLITYIAQVNMVTHEKRRHGGHLSRLVTRSHQQKVAAGVGWHRARWRSWVPPPFRHLIDSAQEVRGRGCVDSGM